VNEWVLNGTSAQLGYTVPFTLVHLEKTRNLKVKTTKKLSTTPKSKLQQNKTALVQSPHTTLDQ